MKKLICLCLLLLAGCAATYDGPTEAKPMLTEYTVDQYYSFFDGEVIHHTNRIVYAYDIYGNRVREMEYQDGELTEVTNMKYDDRGNEISRTDWDRSGWLPKLSNRTRQTYDAQSRILTYETLNFWGRVVSGSYYSYDDEARTRTYRNESGEILQITWFDEQGNDIRQTAGEYETVYEYDDRGNCIGWQSYKDGKPYDRYEADYDEQDRQVRGRRYDAAGNLTSETEYVYDEELSTKSYSKNDGGRRVETYHADGRLHAVEDYEADGSLTMLQRYYYQDILVPASQDTEH